MKNLTSSIILLVVCVALAIGAAVAVASSPSARGGRADPVTTKAPHLVKQVRGFVLVCTLHGRVVAPDAPRVHSGSKCVLPASR